MGCLPALKTVPVGTTWPVLNLELSRLLSYQFSKSNIANV